MNSTNPLPKLPTAFAPAERLGRTMLESQAEFFSHSMLLRQFLDAVPNICLVANQQRQIVFTNQALLKFLGLADFNQILGMRPGEVLNCIHAFETEGGCGTTEFCTTCGAVQALLSSLSGKEAVKECRIIQRDNNALDLRVWATPVQMENELFSFFVVTDISHEKRRRALERIFFHDILNTAGVLQGISDLLDDSPPDELPELTKILQGRSRALIEEIKAQKQLIAAENNELSVLPVPINTIILLYETTESYKAHPVAKERQLQIASDAQEIIFSSDEIILRRVLENMVKNALEASKAGQTVTIGCRSVDNELVEFWVHNPTVMPRKVQLQIFQRSFSTKGSGRGLGTYSIKLLTERYLQGKVSFSSDEESGTTFRVKYPVHFAEATSQSQGVITHRIPDTQNGN